ncbi:hypothetical protein [Halobacillus sp. A5]|uniref:hypothetical protein n=1 Tax=Halobacillus sp. A5 TaxID=2880263 RepID=UPI0020A6D353|nr:hypothetical protein [Halobacillus sp. A5]MCP3029112.1 hypothetical protein [Halobacillus sp. A5]
MNFYKKKSHYTTYRARKLYHRLLPDHPKRSDVQAQFLKSSAGHYGETTADHYLQYLSSDTFRVLKDLLLFDGISSFQIDAEFRRFAGLKSVKVARKLLTEVCSHNSQPVQSRKYFFLLSYYIFC